MMAEKSEQPPGGINKQPQPATEKGDNQPRPQVDTGAEARSKRLPLPEGIPRPGFICGLACP